MFWFLLLIAMAISIPLMFLMAGAWLFVLALPFFAFFVGWALIAWLFIGLFHASALLGVVLGFIIGAFAAKSLAKTPQRS